MQGHFKGTPFSGMWSGVLQSKIKSVTGEEEKKFDPHCRIFSMVCPKPDRPCHPVGFYASIVFTDCCLKSSLCLRVVFKHKLLNRIVQTTACAFDSC